MRISNKIITLIVLLLGGLSFSAWSGLSQMREIRSEYSSMVTFDVALMRGVNGVYQIQLQKNVLLQQLISISEELGFEQTSYARSSYLQDQLKSIRSTYDEYAKEAATQGQKAKNLTIGATRFNILDDREPQLLEIREGMTRLEAVRTDYDASIMKFLKAVEAGGFKLSIEDLEKFQNDENKLTKDVASLLKVVQESLMASLDQAKEWEMYAFKRFVYLLIGVFILAFVLAFWIVSSIVRPINQLSKAVETVGEGNFNVQVMATSKDEVANLAKAFNDMSRKLEEYKVRIESQNKDLKAVNEDLDKFIHVMGHDILNPLTMMIGYCSYIEQHAKPNLDEKNLESLQGIRKAATRMHTMVKELLEYTKSKRVTST